MIKLENIAVGDKFSTETKLLLRLGFTNNKGDSKKANIKEAQRYLKWEKTGKVSRGKVTNQIEVTLIYPTPLDKIENRGGARANAGNKSIYIDDITDLCNLLTIENKSFFMVTPNELRTLFGLIPYKKAFELPMRPSEDDEYLHISQYFYHLRGLLERQIENAQKHGCAIENDYLTWEVKDKIALWNERELASGTQLEVIDLIETYGFDKFCEIRAKHRLGKAKITTKRMLFNNRALNSAWNNFKQEQFLTTFDRYYCPCYNIKSNGACVTRSKDEILDSLKSKYRAESIKHILGAKKKNYKTRESMRRYEFYYTPEEQEQLKKEHETLYGQENWDSEEIANILKESVEKIKRGSFKVKTKKTKSTKNTPLTAEQAKDMVDEVTKYNQFFDNIEALKKLKNAFADLQTGSEEWMEKAIEVGYFNADDMPEIERHTNVVDFVTNPYYWLTDKENHLAYEKTMNSLEKVMDKVRAIASAEQLERLNKFDDFNDFMDEAYSLGLVEKRQESLERIKARKQEIIDDYIKRIDNGETFKTWYWHSEIGLRSDKNFGVINPHTEYNKFYNITPQDDEDDYNNPFED